MTPIRCGADAWAHQDVRPGDTVAWPTNLGWMMGPWLLYAALLNGACIALYQVRHLMTPHALRTHCEWQASWVFFCAWSAYAPALLMPVQGSPLGRDFGEFVARARVTMLGLVPSIAKVRSSEQLHNVRATPER